MHDAFWVICRDSTTLHRKFNLMRNQGIAEPSSARLSGRQPPVVCGERKGRGKVMICTSDGNQMDQAVLK